MIFVKIPQLPEELFVRFIEVIERARAEENIYPQRFLINCKGIEVWENE